MKIICWLLCLFTVLGCGSGVQRVDPNSAEEETNIKFDAKDLNFIARKMAHSLLEHRLAFSNPPKVILVLKVRNKTSEHIDTEDITETIITELLKKGQYRVVAEKEMRGAIDEELQRKKALGQVSEGDDEIVDLDMETLRQYKRKAGVDLVMYGKIGGIEKRTSGEKDVFYKMTLKLVDIETELVEWQDQKDIRKQQTKGVFGW